MIGSGASLQKTYLDVISRAEKNWTGVDLGFKWDLGLFLPSTRWYGESPCVRGWEQGRTPDGELARHFLADAVPLLARTYTC